MHKAKQTEWWWWWWWRTN